MTIEGPGTVKEWARIAACLWQVYVDQRSRAAIDIDDAQSAWFCLVLVINLDGPEPKLTVKECCAAKKNHG